VTMTAQAITPALGHFGHIIITITASSEKPCVPDTHSATLFAIHGEIPSPAKPRTAIFQWRGDLVDPEELGMEDLPPSAAAGGLRCRESGLCLAEEYMELSNLLSLVIYLLG